MISILLTARENSKYLAKFITTFVAHTKTRDVELLIFIPPADTWNKELFECFKDKIRIIPDNTGMGRGAGHIFYSELAKEAKGEWLWYVCDDHYLFDGYDEYILSYIQEHNLDSKKINVIAPFVSNSGRISHILSRKVVELVGFGQHGNVDSYINEMLEYLEVLTGERRLPYVPSIPVMSDFSLDKELMHTKNKADFNPIAQVQLFKSELMKEKIRNDARKLWEVTKK